MHTGTTTESAAARAPYRAADHLRNDKDIAGYIEVCFGVGRRLQEANE